MPMGVLVSGQSLPQPQITSVTPKIGATLRAEDPSYLLSSFAWLPIFMLQPNVNHDFCGVAIGSSEPDEDIIVLDTNNAN